MSILYSLVRPPAVMSLGVVASLKAIADCDEMMSFQDSGYQPTVLARLITREIPFLLRAVGLVKLQKADEVLTKDVSHDSNEDQNATVWK